MHIILLLWLIIIFYFSYFLTGKDFFAPSTMLALSFAFASILSIYILTDHNYSIGAETVVIIGSCLTLSLAIGVAVHSLYSKVTIRPITENVSPIPSEFAIVSLVVMLFVILAQISMIHRISGTGGTFASLMTTFRFAHAYGTDETAQYPLWLRLLLNLSQALFYIFAFNIMKFYKELSKGAIAIQASLIAVIFLSSLLTSGRFTLLTYLIALVYMFHMLRVQRLGKYKTYKLGFIIRITLIIAVAAWFFYYIKSFVGRVSDSNLLDYTANYLGTGIINFDLYLKNPPAPSDIWGKETFYSLINALRRMGLIDVQAYIFHKEFRSLNGYSLGNIYTALRDYHYDFGITGVYILHTIFSLFYSIAYEYVKKRCSNFSIILMSMMYYCVVLYMYNQFFYTNIVAFGFAIRIVMVYVLYELLIRKRIRVRFSRNSEVRI